jgi:thiol-disulfide isomerase/thioredoxin
MQILKLLLIAFIATLITTALSTAKASNLSEELLNMPISLTTGEVVTLKQYQGIKPVYLKFWATWCEPCRQQMPHFEQITQEYGEDLAVIAINLGINDDLTAISKIQEEFGLSMATAIDNNGDLAKAFRLLGTPYHLLFDKQMNLVHIGHKSDTSLDNKIALISNDEPLNLLAEGAITETAKSIELNLEDGKPHALFFTATWCDWYLKDSRPAISQQCISAQQHVSQLTLQYDNINWQGITSRLWTGEPELASYVKKYQIKYPTVIDASNSVFHHYKVKDLPTLVIVKNGEVLFKTSDFSELKLIKEQLSLL